MSILEQNEEKAGQRVIEDVIKNISGIASCHVVINENEEIQEIHVLAENSRSPKQVVRDIESAVMAKLGIQLDHKKISVAQSKATEKISYKRMRIEDVEIKGTKIWLTARVSLKLGEKIFEGIAEGPNSTLNRHKIVANATVQSIEQLLEQKVRIAVEDLSWQTLAGQDIVTVVLSSVTSNKIETLVGSCIGTTDKDMSIVKVVLDALNRRLETL